MNRTYRPTCCPAPHRHREPTRQQPEPLDQANQVIPQAPIKPRLASCESISGQAPPQSYPRLRILQTPWKPSNRPPAAVRRNRAQARGQETRPTKSTPEPAPKNARPRSTKDGYKPRETRRERMITDEILMAEPRSVPQGNNPIAKRGTARRATKREQRGPPQARARTNARLEGTGQTGKP